MNLTKPTPSVGSIVDNKTILVTGGTGSLGYKLAQVLTQQYTPKKLIVFSRDELKQHQMAQQYPVQTGSPIRYFIGDVRDYKRLTRAFTGVDIVVHAAALKQIVTCEYNPAEAVETNIQGTRNVIDAVLECRVPRALFVSSDKAVNPVNTYGATKLCGEKLFVQSNAYVGQAHVGFSCVRYGNVVGSRGSVVPIFKQQATTGTLTVTDKRMTRFWITLDQVAQFVLTSLARMQGGEVFVPKLPSMKILDLAAHIAPDCKILYTGIRPGEKLHEVLVSTAEAPHTREFTDHYLVLPAHPWWPIQNGGKPVPAGFSYASNTNTQWITEF